MRTTEIFAVTMALLALGGCQRQDSDGPTELNGRHFVFNYRVSTATYLVNLALKAPIPDGSFAIAEFENPMGGDPLVVREKIFPLWDKITLQSPAVTASARIGPMPSTSGWWMATAKHSRPSRRRSYRMSTNRC